MKKQDRHSRDGGYELINDRCDKHTFDTRVQRFGKGWSCVKRTNRPWIFLVFPFFYGRYGRLAGRQAISEKGRVALGKETAKTGYRGKVRQRNRSNCSDPGNQDGV